MQKCKAACVQKGEAKAACVQKGESKAAQFLHTENISYLFV